MDLGTDDGAASLESFIGQAFGDMSDGALSPDAGDAAGAPPAERPEDAPESTTASTTDTPTDDTTGTEPEAGAPPADAALSPDVAAPEAPAPDPLADATPLTYTVNGEPRTYAGIKVLGEDGAVIDKADLPDVIRRLGERDHLYETNQAQYQQLRGLERLSEWKTTDAEGKETTLSGADGLAAFRMEHGKLSAAFETLAGYLKDPVRFASLVGIEQDAQGNAVIVPNAETMRHLLTECDLAEERAEKSVRSQLVALVQPKAPANAPVDVQAHAPKIIAQAAGPQAATLTEKDRTFLAAQLPRYVRTVTEADRQQNPALVVGKPIVDAAFTQVVADRVAIRAEQAALVSSTTAAATSNAARLAAAARGTKPAAPARTPARPAAPVADTSSDAWDLMQQLTSGRPARAG